MTIQKTLLEKMNLTQIFKIAVQMKKAQKLATNVKLDENNKKNNIFKNQILKNHNKLNKN